MSETSKRIDRAKEASIAFLSTSALLMTLVLGFIAGKVSPALAYEVGIATWGLYFTVGFAAVTLFLVTVVDTPRLDENPTMRWGLTLLLFAQVISFVLGLGALSTAIHYALST